MPKIRQNTFGVRALPGPAGELKHSPSIPLATMRGLLVREEGWKGKGREREEGKGGPPVVLTPALAKPLLFATQKTLNFGTEV